MGNPDVTPQVEAELRRALEVAQPDKYHTERKNGSNELLNRFFAIVQHELGQDLTIRAKEHQFFIANQFQLDFDSSSTGITASFLLDPSRKSPAKKADLTWDYETQAWVGGPDKSVVHEHGKPVPRKTAMLAVTQLFTEILQDIHAHRSKLP